MSSLQSQKGLIAFYVARSTSALLAKKNHVVLCKMDDVTGHRRNTISLLTYQNKGVLILVS